MKIFSKRFQTELEFDDQKVISMPWGLPGFPDSKRFCILELSEEGAPFKWFHDIDNTTVALLITNPFDFFPNYMPHINPAVIEELDIKDVSAELTVFTIVKVAQGGKEAFTNLRAPVVCNASTMKARQVILEDETYSVKTPLFESAAAAETPQQAVNS